MDNKTRNGIIVAAVVAVAGLVAFKLIKGKKPSQNGGNNGGGGNNSGGTGGSDTGGGVPLDYQSLANDLFDAMDGYGTYEDDIIEVFEQLRNNNDFDSLKSAFGVRTISSGRGNIFQSDFEGDMIGCLRDELSDSYIADINKILTDKNISRRV